MNFDKVVTWITAIFPKPSDWLAHRTLIRKPDRRPDGVIKNQVISITLLLIKSCYVR